MFKSTKEAKHLADTLKKSLETRGIGAEHSQCLLAVARAAGYADWLAVTCAETSKTMPQITDETFQLNLACLLDKRMSQQDVRAVMSEVCGARDKKILPVTPLPLPARPSAGALLGTEASQVVLDAINANLASLPQQDEWRDEMDHVRDNFLIDIIEPQKRASENLHRHMERRRNIFEERVFFVEKPKNLKQ